MKNVSDTVKAMQRWGLDTDSVFKDLLDEATCLSLILNITILVPRCSLRQKIQ